MNRAGDVVLVLRALGLGDALTGVAALRGVRRAWPDHQLVLAGPGSSGAWLRQLGVVDAVLPAAGLAPLGGDGPGGHVAVNLHGRGPQSHRLLRATRPSRLVGFAAGSIHPDGPDWRAEEHEVDRWCRLVSAAGGWCDRQDLRLHRSVEAPVGRADVALHPGAAAASRRWPFQRWTQVASWLSRSGHQVTLTGSAAERPLCEAIVSAAVTAGAPPIRTTAGTLDVPSLAAVVAGARLGVSGDTGVAHLATALAAPSVVLFGPPPPRWWGPAIDPELHTVLWHCDQHPVGDPHGSRLDPSLADITAAETIGAIESQLARTATAARSQAG